jgi:NADH:ubiquinone oxidoreductase subunit C
MNLATATDLWQSANWAEREAFDMFGFNFKGHPNLTRILCHFQFVGHALRKDYPIMKGQWASGTSDLRPDLERE